ncbi:MAG: T9SS type A sorting domain-containing protein [Bacteroidia bacterium]|nr:T9SS type A sorting domain-containing protein [Bacteroidia bacterium]
MKFSLVPLFLLLCLTAFSQAQDIYVSDAGNFQNGPWQILKFDPNGQNPTVFINTNLGWPQDILFLNGTNDVLISNFTTGCITRHNASTGAWINNFACNIGGPTRMKIGQDSLLYVLQWNGNGRVRRYTLGGVFVDQFTSVGVPQSIGFDWDLQGNLYVSSYTADLVRKFDPQGADLGVFIDSNLVGPTNIWFDSQGDLLVADYDGGAVRRFDANGNYVGDFITGVGHTEGVAFYPNGDILLGNGVTSSVRMYDHTGTFIKTLVASGAGNLINPNAIVFHESVANSLPEAAAPETAILYPNSGREFHISPKYVGKIASVSILDTGGRLVEKVNSSNLSLLKADHLSEGIYLVSFELHDGSTRSGKILVR